MIKILETERLLLREMTAEDAEMVYLLNLDSDVVRFTGEKPFESVEQARLFLLNFDEYKKYSFGRWAVIRKEDGLFLGWCGLKYYPERDEVDVGFRFFKKFRALGYATESARACLDLGFEKFKLKTIIAYTMFENTASKKVLNKIGLTYDKTLEMDGREWMIFKVERPVII